MKPTKKDMWDNVWLHSTNDPKWPASLNVEAIVIYLVQQQVWDRVYNQLRLHLRNKMQ